MRQLWAATSYLVHNRSSPVVPAAPIKVATRDNRTSLVVPAARKKVVTGEELLAALRSSEKRESVAVTSISLLSLQQWLQDHFNCEFYSPTRKPTEVATREHLGYFRVEFRGESISENSHLTSRASPLDR